MFNYSPFHSFLLAKSDSGTAVVPNIEINALELISNFYVTCPRLTKKEEDEHKRILYYYPPEETSKRKARLIFINFMLHFRPKFRVWHKPS